MSTDKRYEVAVIIVSDRAYSGEREDLCADVIRAKLLDYPFDVSYVDTVPDEVAKIRKAIGEAVKAKVDLILTSGGTGFSGRDVTPEATKQEIEKEAPGIAEAIRAHSMAITKRAMLSRGIAGISGNSLIINLPGSPKAVAESIDAFVDQLEHAFKMMAGGGH
ncbi:MAG TPA: MogA/MoaB family molybdenum cofactor biosynthesis protein [Fastidiosipila sp.]|nr:MogA/MoaB family molybdenum cofactor biosynthesis protein [Fastidiosipila sp.]